jgi:hypothetical protein
MENFWVWVLHVMMEHVILMDRVVQVRVVLQDPRIMMVVHVNHSHKSNVSMDLQRITFMVAELVATSVMRDTLNVQVIVAGKMMV